LQTERNNGFQFYYATAVQRRVPILQSYLLPCIVLYFKLCFCLLYVAYFLGLFSFISLFVLLWYERFIAEMCSRDVILELRSVRWELSAQVRSTVERAGCGRTCRGRRAGKHVKARRHCIAYSETSDGEIPVVSKTCRRRSNSSSGYVGDRDRRDVVLRGVTTHSTTTDMAVNREQPLTRSSVDYRPSIYVINTAAITKPHPVHQLSTDINSYNVDIAAVTETHLKNKHTDSVVAIPGYILLRRDRLRRNGGGVALCVRSSLSVSLWTFSADNRTYNYFGPNSTNCS